MTPTKSAPDNGEQPGTEHAGAGSAATSAHDSTLTRGVVWQGSLRWLSQILAWTATIVVARKLAPDDYGISGAATVLVGLLMLGFESGIGRALVYRRERDERILEEANAASLLLGGLASLALILASVPLARFYHDARVAPVMMTNALVLMLTGASAVPIAVLQQRLEYRRLATIDFSKAIMQASTVLLCATLGLRYWSLAIGLLTGNVLAVLVARRWVPVAVRRPRWATLAPTLKYALELTIGIMAWFAYSNADFAVVGRVLGLAALGYYQFAWNVAQLPGDKLANVLQAVAGPFFGSIGDDRRTLRHYFLTLSLLLSSVVFPALIGFALVSPIAIPMIFGDRWVAAIPLMQILIARAALSTLSLLGQHVLGATGYARVSTRMNVIALIVLPIAFYVAARLGGAMAVALCWLLVQPVLVGVPLSYLKRAIDLSIPAYLLSLRAPVVSALIMTGAVLLVRQVLGTTPPLVQLVAMIVLGAVSYSGAYALLFRQELRGMIALWRSRG